MALPTVVFNHTTNPPAPLVVTMTQEEADHFDDAEPPLNGVSKFCGRAERAIRDEIAAHGL